MTCYVEKTKDTKLKFSIGSIANKFRIYKKSKNNSLKNIKNFDELNIGDKFYRLNKSYNESPFVKDSKYSAYKISDRDWDQNLDDEILPYSDIKDIIIVNNQNEMSYSLKTAIRNNKGRPEFKNKSEEYDYYFNHFQNQEINKFFSLGNKVFDNTEYFITWYNLLENYKKFNFEEQSGLGVFKFKNKKICFYTVKDDDRLMLIDLKKLLK